MSKEIKNKISKEGEEFILSLNMYLISTGKSESEIKEFISEAEEHLILGEQEGKSVKDIFGDSPEEYAKSVAKELSYSKKDLIETALLFIIGFGTWIFLSAIKENVVTMSMMQLISMPLVYLVTIIFLVFFAKKFAFNDKKFSISLTILFIINIASLVIIQVIGRNLEQVIIINRLTVNIIIGILLLLSIVLSIKIGVWYLIMPFIFYLPSIIENYTNISFNDNILIDIIPAILCLILCAFESKRITKSVK